MNDEGLFEDDIEELSSAEEFLQYFESEVKTILLSLQLNMISRWCMSTGCISCNVFIIIFHRQEKVCLKMKWKNERYTKNIC